MITYCKASHQECANYASFIKIATFDNFLYFLIFFNLTIIYCHFLKLKMTNRVFFSKRSQILGVVLQKSESRRSMLWQLFQSPQLFLQLLSHFLHFSPRLLELVKYGILSVIKYFVYIDSFRYYMKYI